MIKCDETKPYIFISYSHRDSDKVIKIIERLQSEGYNVWYDEGIDPGTEWDENIAKHVIECSYFIAFISNGYIGSKNCKDELNYSRDLDKEQLLVYLEEVNLSGGMAMRMNRIQAIFWYKYDKNNTEDAYRKLFSAKGIARTKLENDTPKKEVPVETAKVYEAPEVSVQEVSVQEIKLQEIPADEITLQESNEKKNTRSKLLLWIGIAAAVLVALIVAIVLVLVDGKKPSRNNEEAEYEETSRTEDEEEAEAEENEEEVSPETSVYYGEFDIVAANNNTNRGYMQCGGNVQYYFHPDTGIRAYNMETTEDVNIVDGLIYGINCIGEDRIAYLKEGQAYLYSEANGVGFLSVLADYSDILNMWANEYGAFFVNYEAVGNVLRYVSWADGVIGDGINVSYGTCVAIVDDYLYYVDTDYHTINRISLASFVSGAPVTEQVASLDGVGIESLIGYVDDNGTMQLVYAGYVNNNAGSVCVGTVDTASGEYSHTEISASHIEGINYSNGNIYFLTYETEDYVSFETTLYCIGQGGIASAVCTTNECYYDISVYPDGGEIWLGGWDYDTNMPLTAWLPEGETDIWQVFREE